MRVVVVLILLCIAAVFVGGLLVMKRLDLFFAGRNACPEVGEENKLRIAFENPVIAASVAAELEAFSKSHPSCKLLLFTGTAAQIKAGLASGILDIGVLLSMQESSAAIRIPLICAPVYSDACDANIHPLALMQPTACILTGKTGCDALRDALLCTLQQI